jgi:hypothetical protein
MAEPWVGTLTPTMAPTKLGTLSRPRGDTYRVCLMSVLNASIPPHRAKTVASQQLKAATLPLICLIPLTHYAELILRTLCPKTHSSIICSSVFHRRGR